MTSLRENDSTSGVILVLASDTSRIQAPAFVIASRCCLLAVGHLTENLLLRIQNFDEKKKNNKINE